MVIGVASDRQQNFDFLISDCFIDNLENKSAASTIGGNFDEFKNWEGCMRSMQ
jgi:hypothetical protein